METVKLKVSALGFRVGWTPAHNNEWTNDSWVAKFAVSY